MAAVTVPEMSAERRERLFFLGMAAFVAAVIASGFVVRIANGTVTFDRPWWVHVHAASFMAWLGLYVTQSQLAFQGTMGRHRALGRVGIALAVWMTIVGIALTTITVAVGRTPPFFTPAYFLALDWLNALFFLLLVAWAVGMRHRSDWHRRLMLCATLCVGIPGFARLILLAAPPPTLAKQLAIAAALVLPALLFDLATRRRVHLAYAGGVAAVIAMALLVAPVSRLPTIVALVERLTSP